MQCTTCSSLHTRDNLTTVLSKVPNQMRHSVLLVFPVRSVRSLTHQVMTDTKRRRVGDGLAIVSDNPEEEARVTHTMLRAT